MANSFKFYADAALTTLVANPFVISQNEDGTDGDYDGVVYYGSPSAGVTAQADSNPGVDQIVVSISDTTALPGDGPEPADLKLASSNANLTAAVAGDPLNLGLTVTSGAGNQVEVHFRMQTPTVITPGTFNELSFATNPTREI